MAIFKIGVFAINNPMYRRWRVNYDQLEELDIRLQHFGDRGIICGTTGESSR